ncbi:membrane protein [Carnobacterium maltaromaticum]|uniref:YitT family protein n=1 Tax=Carnobacterium maltaromaticum TaxID=2751 RepID=UPI000C756141|nr:YitT family protein [Carnobacterium maltaromaticum]PLS34517.1 membrane protein [Carnobacterium maltaromaticum]PLS35022.1 membrane protein [Carnobacterium maltaromaticum]PLS35435.1 membrane protein [Carnobacterium maltaromaticum]PLS41989.1 membrane protein [Carnobacterium maltaromaticum]PLS44824.1 membrane protein [Carnobacterium maltaromaticum]
MIKEIKKTPMILLGLIFISIGLNWFLLPHDIAAAGVGSIGHLVEINFSINRSLTVWSINITMLVMAALFLGKLVFIKSVIGSLLFPIILGFVPMFALLSSHFISLIIGSLLFSLGVYSLYSVGASNGGITIPPIIFNKYFRLSISKGLLLTNLIIIFFNYITFGLLETAFVILSIGISTLFITILTNFKPVVHDLAK